MNKFLSILAAATAVFLCFVLAGPGEARGLPEVEGFIAGDLKTSPLEAPAGEYGEWLTRVYRDGRGRTVRVTLMAGPGAGSLRTPPEGTRSDDRPIGFGAVYEGLTVGGRPALLETVPSLGFALAVALDGDSTLTLESSSMPGDELAEIAAKMITSM